MISIIVNCYNLEKYIGAAVESLLNQDCEMEFEILVINDASTDNSLNVLKQFDDNRLTIIDLPENKGAQYGVELAFGKTKGKYICRFDGDDVWPPHFLSSMSRILDVHTEISMVYSDVSFIDSSGTVISTGNNINRRDKHQPVLENEFMDILKEYYINAPTIMFRREAFAKALPLPPQLRNFIDFYTSLKVLETGKAYYVNESMAYYRLHSANGHKIVVQNKNNEEVTEYILQSLIMMKPSINSNIKNNIAAINYFRLGNDYFGAKMFRDAKKYYLKTVSFQPSYIFNSLFIKRILSVMLGHKVYSKTKNLVRKDF